MRCYRQEYYKGVAEDRADVLSTTESATVPAGSFRDLVMTKDYNPLDSAAPIEHNELALQAEIAPAGVLVGQVADQLPALLADLTVLLDLHPS